MTAGPGDARRWASENAFGPDDVACAIGGDGTIHEVVNGLMGRADSARPTLGVIPGGTGNALMRDMGVRDPLVGMDRIVSDRPRLVDLMKVDHADGVSYAFNIVGYGLIATGNATAEKLRVLGKRRYDAAGLLGIARRPVFHGELTIDDEPILSRSLMVVFSNTKHCGEGMLMAPKASLNDGLMDVVYVGDVGRLALLRLFAGLGKGDHVNSPDVGYVQARAACLDASGDHNLNINNKLKGRAPFRVAMLPGALKILA